MTLLLARIAAVLVAFAVHPGCAIRSESRSFDWARLLSAEDAAFRPYDYRRVLPETDIETFRRVAAAPLDASIIRNLQRVGQSAVAASIMVSKDDSGELGVYLGVVEYTDGYVFVTNGSTDTHGLPGDAFSGAHVWDVPSERHAAAQRALHCSGMIVEWDHDFSWCSDGVGVTVLHTYSEGRYACSIMPFFDLGEPEREMSITGSTHLIDAEDAAAAIGEIWDAARADLFRKPE